VVAKLGNERDQAFVNVGRGFSRIEHCREGLEKIRRDFLRSFVEEFHGDAIVSQRLSFGQGANGVVYLFQGEVSDQIRVCVF
jgi:hypothetical protein